MSDFRKDKISVFKHLYESNISSLTQFARRYTNEIIAKDIVQDVFLELWKIDKELDGITSKSYLFMAVRNKCMNHLRQEKLRNSLLNHTLIDIKLQQLDYFDSVEKTMINSEELQYIFDQIELLPEKCKQIFKLSYFEEKKSFEIAELLQLSIRTVEHQLYLGLKTLRSKLKKR